MSKGKAFIFAAPSGSGKTTIVKHLLEQDLKLGFSISASTRDKRGRSEAHGSDYYFLTRDEFIQHINQDDFIEWEEVYDIIDTIVEERDRYKKALKDLREWAKQEEHIWSLGKEMDCFVATHYYAMLEEIDKTLKETYKIEIGGETIDFPKD